MKLNQLSIIKSERGLRAALSSLFFGAKGALLTAATNFNGIENTVKRLVEAGYVDRADNIRESARYVQLRDKLQAAAIRAGSIHAMADNHGANFEINLMPDLQQGKDLKQLTAESEASGVPLETIKAKEIAAIKRRYDQQMEALVLAESEFYVADYDDGIDLRTETVLNALIRERDRMLEWRNLDLGELTVLRHDIDAIELIFLKEQEAEERTTDGSIDDALIGEKSMTQLNQEHQDQIALAKGDKPKRGSKTHRVAAH